MDQDEESQPRDVEKTLKVSQGPQEISVVEETDPGDDEYQAESEEMEDDEESNSDETDSPKRKGRPRKSSNTRGAAAKAKKPLKRTMDPKNPLKQKAYPQGYRSQWESLEFCRGWLKPHPGNKYLAICAACDHPLKTRKNDLRKHSLSEKHKANFEALQNGLPKPISPTKNRQKFHPSLLKEFPGWLSQVPDDPYHAWCRTCQGRLTPAKKNLVVHAKSKKHLSRASGPQRDPPVAGEWVTMFDDGDGGGDGDDTFNDGGSPPSPGPQLKFNLTPASPPPDSDFTGRVTYSIGLGNRKVGFLGAGQIAQALAQGMLEQGLLQPHDIIVSAPTKRNMIQWKRWKCTIATSNDEVLQTAEILFLAVKGSVLPGLVNALLPISDDKTRLFISLIPGVTRSRVAELLGTRITSFTTAAAAGGGEGDSAEQEEQQPETVSCMHVVRCATNKMVSISAGFCAYTMGDDLPHALHLVLETMFSALGSCHRVEEDLMNSYSTMVGSGSAFACAFIEAMVQAGVSLNMPWDDALTAAAAVVSGTSKMLMRTNTDPSILRKSISTPGGSTIVGVTALQRGGLDETVVKAMELSAQKTEEIGSKV